MTTSVPLYFQELTIPLLLTEVNKKIGTFLEFLVTTSMRIELHITNLISDVYRHF